MESKQTGGKGPQTQASAQASAQAKELGQVLDAIDLLSSRLFNIENMLLTLVRACFECNKDRLGKSVGSLCKVCSGTGYVRIKP